ncbi:golgin subfamily A member 7B isoform X2 [Pan paniscus]|uniref:golgin subfamily A member 7B isoform X2 n=1 Tax=Pan paniscus TaxID=9597 RepID=UPI0024365028|nr:golgin subfamily A member 7B isoform X2 [Pan paniscus]
MATEIERQLFEETVKTLNGFYAEAEKIGGSSYLEGCLACATAYFIFLCMETHYEKVLKKISRYIQEQNEKIFAPRGLLLTDPVERGMRVIEISIYEDRCSSGSSSSGSSSGSGSSSEPSLRRFPHEPSRATSRRIYSPGSAEGSLHQAHNSSCKRMFKGPVISASAGQQNFACRILELHRVLNQGQWRKWETVKRVRGLCQLPPFPPPAIHLTFLSLTFVIMRMCIFINNHLFLQCKILSLLQK